MQLENKKNKKNKIFFGLAIVAAPKAAILQVLSKAKNLLASVQLATGGWSESGMPQSPTCL